MCSSPSSQDEQSASQKMDKRKSMRRKSVSLMGMEMEWEVEDTENQWKADFEGFWVRIAEEGVKEVRNV